ncbi:hypothetical protein C4E44_33845 [Pseudomonas sp. MWU12-2312b]|nr:hypothetical protein C4E44_33845 [Pseudomonas sp. MWU12-2312b]
MIASHFLSGIGCAIVSRGNGQDRVGVAFLGTVRDLPIPLVFCGAALSQVVLTNEAIGLMLKSV